MKERPFGRSPRQSGRTVTGNYSRSECTCSINVASDLLDEWTDRALDGDADAVRMLPAIAQYLLDAERWEGVR
jgi:hypothetical protein